MPISYINALAGFTSAGYLNAEALPFTLEAVPAYLFGASASNQTTSVSISAGSNIATLTNAIDFENGQGLYIPGAGVATSVIAPSSVTISNAGTAGTSSYTYVLMAFDINGGAPAPVSVTTTTGNATLSSTNYNSVNIGTAAGSAAFQVLYRTSVPVGSALQLGVIDIVSPGATSISDTGQATQGVLTPNGFLFGTSQPTYTGIPCIVPVQAPTTALGQFFVSKILFGAGTTSLILSSSATTTVTNLLAYHDDTAAIQAGINAGNTLFLSGNYPISSTITLAPGSSLLGQSTQTTSVFARQFGNSWGGNFNNWMLQGTDCNWVTLKGFTLVGPGLNAVAGSGLEGTINVNGNVQGWDIEMSISQVSGDGIFVNTPVQCRFSSIYGVYVGGDMLHIYSGTSVSVNNCYANTCVGAGYHFDGGAYYSVNGCAADGCGISYLNNNMESISYNGCGSEVPQYRSGTYNGIHYSNTNSVVSIQSCYARDFAVAKNVAGDNIYITANSSSVVNVNGFIGKASTNAPSAIWSVDSTSQLTMVNPQFSGLSSTKVVGQAATLIPSAILITLVGTTAGNIYWSQPEQGTRKVFTAAIVGYENDTATAQTITFPTPFLYTPSVAVSTNTAGLTVTATTTVLTISSDSTTVFNGVIDVVGI